MSSTEAPAIATKRYDEAMERLRTQPTIGIPDTVAVTGLGEHTVRRLIREGEIRTLALNTRTLRVLTAPLRERLGID